MLEKMARMITEYISNPSDGGTASAAPSLQIAPSRTAGIQDDLGPVLAQVPDLDNKLATKVAAIPLDGRIISQVLSMKMVFGLGIGLVIGALMPFLFGKGSNAKPVHELPDWNSHNAEPAVATEQFRNPKWQPAPPASVSAPLAANVGIAPPPPPLGNYRPAAMGPPSWSPPQTSAAPPATPQQYNNYGPDYANGNPPPARVDYRANAPATDGRDWQADRRNDAAAPYRASPAGDYRGTPVDPVAARREGPSYGPPTDDRYGNNTNPAGGQNSPPRQPNGYNTGGNYRYPPESDPGVARFDGTITAPPVRTNE
jgi:hypothetical protein